MRRSFYCVFFFALECFEMQFSDFFKSHSIDELCNDGDFGIYVHVPFCLRRCRYCAFCSSVIRPVPSADYVDSLCAEFDLRKYDYLGKNLTSLYFGGGTPSMLDVRDVHRLISHIINTFNTPDEITFEVNPEHVDLSHAVDWKSSGISRISLGIQSFNDQILAMLGRRHTSIMAKNAVDTLHKSGFDEVCIDLIYGAHLPEISSDSEEIKRWLDDLKTARSLEPAHVSCYELTLEKNTPLDTDQKRGKNILCSDLLCLEMMHQIQDILGFEQYEISNYSHHNYYSLHNLSCWAGLPYLGLGPGAHSLIRSNQNIIRKANTNNVRLWLNAFKSNSNFPPPCQFSESLSSIIHLAERLICAARTRFEWSPKAIAQSLNIPLDPFIPCLNKAIERGFLVKCDDGKVCTAQLGIDLNNQLDEILFDFQD